LFACKNQNEDKEFKDELKFWYRRQEMYEQKKEQIRKYVSPNRNDIFQQQYVHYKIVHKFFVMNFYFIYMWQNIFNNKY